MGFEIATEIHLDADSQEVWEVLTRSDAFWEWNPMLKWKHGELALGQEIQFALAVGQLQLPVRAMVDVFEPGRMLSWTGPWPPLLRCFGSGCHTFRLLSADGGGVRLLHGEIFRGPAFFAVPDFLKRRIRGLYLQFNRALKERVEGCCPKA